MILILDNHDSFVFNIARYLCELEQCVQVISAHAITIAQIEQIKPKALVISPGPCTPNQAGISMQALQHFSQKIPILGVCLGHQCLGEFYGGKVERAQKPLHGFSSKINNNQKNLFKNCPKEINVGRYHSLIVERTQKLDNFLSIDATTDEGEIMAISHRSLPLFGLQFHPESVLSEHGHTMLKNFIEYAK